MIPQKKKKKKKKIWEKKNNNSTAAEPIEQAALFFSQVHRYPVPAPSTAAAVVGSHNALNSYDI